MPVLLSWNVLIQESLGMSRPDYRDSHRFYTLGQESVSKERIELSWFISGSFPLKITVSKK